MIMKWNLNKPTSLGFLIALLSLIAVGAISYYSLSSFRDIRKNEIRTRRFLTELENVNSYFKDIEAGQYAYVLTGDITYLEPYKNARILINDVLLALMHEYEYEDETKIQNLKILLDRQSELAAQVIRLRKQQGRKAARQSPAMEAGKNTADAIRQLILQLKIEKTKIYGLQASEADIDADWAILFIIFGNLLALSFLVTAVLLLNRDIGKLKDTQNQLNKAIDRANQAHKKEEQFLANMSHEIRTPMNAIIGMTNLILNTSLEPKQKSYLKAIRQSSDNLMVIINEILDFSKITAGKIEFERVHFNLSDIFYGLYNTFKIKADEKGLKITPIIDENLPDTVIGDPAKLNQVLVNLIGNSIKFTSQGGIDIMAKLLVRDEDDLLIEFSVKDTGIGIPQDKLATIFEDFAQAASDTSRKFGGTGLGLSISKKIVELQGGKIRVESKQGQGSVFSFSLPFRAGTEKIEKKELNRKASAQELHGLKILLVDDNEFNQVVAVDTLNTLIRSLTIDVAENGRAAIEKLKTVKGYDLILMDVQMPEMNGYEATRLIREGVVPTYREIPIIAMTASATKPEIDRCFESGMTDFVSKPFDADILLIKMATLINKERKEVPAEKVTEPVSVVDASPKGPANLSFLINMTAGDKGKMLKYLDMFLESVPPDWEFLKKKAGEKNWPEVALRAHAMKPRINYMGLQEGAELIKRIEEYTSGQINTDDIPELIVRLENILYLTYRQLKLEKESLVT